MKIFATSDLHLDQKENFAALKKSVQQRSPKGEGCLVLAGDICETEAQLEEILSLLRPFYQEIVWLPGNHELWIRPSQKQSYQELGLGSEEKYKRLVYICRKYAVYTPEDPYFQFKNKEGKRRVLVPMLLLYDHRFSPKSYSTERSAKLGHGK